MRVLSSSSNDESVPPLGYSHFDSDSDEELKDHQELRNDNVQVNFHEGNSCSQRNARLLVSVNVNERQMHGSLVERGANGGILGYDAVVTLLHKGPMVDVPGIDNHKINGLKLVDATAKVITQRGPAIVLIRQYVHHGLLCTIHAAGQIEHYKNRVDDRLLKIGGKQCIKTNDGYIVSLTSTTDCPTSRWCPTLPKRLIHSPRSC